MGVAEGQVWADQGARTLIGASENFQCCSLKHIALFKILHYYFDTHLIFNNVSLRGWGEPGRLSGGVGGPTNYFVTPTEGLGPFALLPPPVEG